MQEKSKITIQLKDILYSVSVSVNKTLKDIVDNVILSTRFNNYECVGGYNCTYDLVIICDYDMSVEVIRRIHAICNSPSDFVEIILK